VTTNQVQRELNINRRAPGISNLLFADDTLLFFKAGGMQAQVIKNAINSYEKCRQPRPISQLNKLMR
jgi:hypothetical protein